MKPAVKVVENPTALFRAAGREFVRIANAAIAEYGNFSVALSGGSTPKGLYSLLATDAEFRSKIPWEKTHFFWGDERYVPPGDAQSNYRMAMEAMLSKVPVPEGNIHRIRTELGEPEEVARAYEAEIRDFFQMGRASVPTSRVGAVSKWPRFDLILLGLGPDGHTASLFPGTRALHEKARLVVANWVEKFQDWRITLTLPVLNHAKSVLFLVSGADKAEMVQRVLASSDADVLPAQMVQPGSGQLTWLLDQAAAGSLSLN